MYHFFEEISNIFLWALVIVMVLITITFIQTSTLIGKSYREVFKIQRKIENINGAAIDYLVKTGGIGDVGGSKTSEEIIQELIDNYELSENIATVEDFKVSVLVMGEDGELVEIDENDEGYNEGHSGGVRGDIIQISTDYEVMMMDPLSIFGILFSGTKKIKPRTITTQGYVHRHRQNEV